MIGWWRKRRDRKTKPRKETRLYDVDFIETHRAGWPGPTVETIRADMGKSWQPPPDARRPQRTIDG